jgi:uncharacterized protein
LKTKTQITNFARTTREALGYYVYALVDPRDDKIFYVGKASGNNRAFNHFKAAADETEKTLRIKEIRSVCGVDPTIDILRYDLSKEAVFDVEAAVIDAIGLENLTNAVRGHGVERGRLSAQEIDRLHGSKPIDVATVKEPLMLFFIQQTYSPTLSENELYDSTRQFWYDVSESTMTPDLDSGELPYQTALAIADSIVVRAYSVATWLPAGTTFSTRVSRNPLGRFEFVGNSLQEYYLLGKMLHKNGERLPANQKGYGYLN